MESIFETSLPASVEIFSTGWCNLNCNYCYIPKTELMKKIHLQIAQKIESGEYVQELKRLYKPDKLRHIGLWGTEPTLTIMKFSKIIPELMEYFPNFVEIGLSTNMIGGAPAIFEEFMMTLPKDRKWKFSVQTSVDGPEEITDANRRKGASVEIIDNVCRLTKFKNDNNELLKHVELHISCKATWSMENIKWLIQDMNNLRKFFSYFDDAYVRIKESNYNNSAIINSWSTSCGSLTVPGKYTVEDGKIYSTLVKMHMDLLLNKDRSFAPNIKCDDMYQIRTQNIFTNGITDYTHDRSEKIDGAFVSCSAGRSNFGLGDVNDLHMCHRSFFLNKEGYMDELRATSDIDNWDVSNFDKGLIEALNYNLICDVNDKSKVSKILYNMGGHHFHNKFKFGCVFATIKELLADGQVSKAYEDDNLCKLASYFMCTAAVCPLENVLNTGSTNTFPLSLYRIFFNGAFEVMLEHTFKKIGIY